tara:strand:+ start:537 stop:1568 length:1032 start_codon:yes stop_codon:yes gene_type:complete
MATINPSLVSAQNAGNQALYTIDYTGVNLFPNGIAGISKASPAIVTVPVVASVISATGTIGTVTGSGTTSAPWTATITLMTKTTGLVTGQIITATDGVGSFSADGEVSVYTVVGTQSIVIHKIGGDIPVAGTVTNISVPAVSSLPAGLQNGDAIIISGVGGMTQLATAGLNGTNTFYVDVLSGNTFALYKDSEINTAVDSSAFTTATANTGIYNTFTVTKYNSIGTVSPIIWDTIDDQVGADISLDLTTGEITLQADITYAITVAADILGGQGFYKIILEGSDPLTAVGNPSVGGIPLTVTFTPTIETVMQILVYTNSGEPWVYPSRIKNSRILIQAIAGYTA